MAKISIASRKFLPKDVIIIHEDRDILVVDKPAGILTIATDAEETNTLYYMLTDYVRKGNPKSIYRIFIVHRLDKDTSGIIVFAKSEQAKKYLQDNWEKTEKHYLALVAGTFKEKTGVLESYLVENKAHNVYSTPDSTLGKLARTEYKVLKESNNFSLLDITLHTGRKHQIRVQFADINHPLAGDKKYGVEKVKFNRLGLHSYSLSFDHPYSKERVTFRTKIPAFVHKLIGSYKVESEALKE
ncbi:MAG: RNA pseudouridine synthase [Candidatus Cloacimonetes bacterium]|nr:RNA pseudouridine synthase [Candidatus Cloacimonadota bacterium]